MRENGKGQYGKREVGIGTAGLRLRRSYNQVQRLIMLGTLKGERKADGNWVVDGVDLDRFCAEDAARTAANNPAA